MTLYEIDSKIAEAIENIFANADEETGEVNEADMEALELLQLEREDKLDNIACYIKSLEAENKAIAEEEKNLRHRKQVNTNKAERLREFLQFALNGERLTTARNKITYRKSTQVQVFDESAIPEAYIRIKAEPNKTAIKEAILTGQDIPGAILTENNNMVIK